MDLRFAIQWFCSVCVVSTFLLLECRFLNFCSNYYDYISSTFQILRLLQSKYSTRVLFSALLNLLKEKERLKQEKRDEKRLNKERKLEQRRLELEMAKELKKPNEDMCLADQKVTVIT